VKDVILTTENFVANYFIYQDMFQVGLLAPFKLHSQGYALHSVLTCHIRWFKLFHFLPISLIQASHYTLRATIYPMTIRAL